MSKVSSYLSHALEALLFLVLFAVVLAWEFTPWEAALTLVFFIGIVTVLNDTFFSRAFRKAIADIRRNALPLVLAGIVCALLFVWDFSFETIVFVGLFVAFLLYKWDSRVLAGAALVSLGMCPLLLLLGDEIGAEQMAIYAYYFLIMTVVLQIIEYKRETKGERKLLEKDSAVLDLRKTKRI